MTTHELHSHLTALQAERAAASLAGLDGNRLYLDALCRETEAARNAYVGAAVTEIASLRARLGARLQG